MYCRRGRWIINKAFEEYIFNRRGKFINTLFMEYNTRMIELLEEFGAQRVKYCLDKNIKLKDWGII
jgi:hypothetical protein